MRAICHCTICQAFNQADYADITMFREDNVDLPDKKLVDYQTYSSTKLVQRGKCVNCEQPVAEYMQLGPLGKIIAVPTANISTDALLPEPALHIFYHRRVVDVDDGLPKYSSFWSSQFAFSSKLLGRLVKSNFR